MTEIKLRKSARTRLAILETARNAFSALGYERASLREIARQASVDPSLVVRYFGSKDALFAEAAEFDLALPADLGASPGDIGVRLARHFLTVWEGPEAGGFALLLRSSASNEFAAERMRAVLSEQVLPVVAALAPGDVPLRAGLVASQLLGLALTRYVLKLPPVVGLTTGEIVATIGETLQRYIMAPLPRP